MRTNLPFILHRQQLGLAENGTDVVLSWNVWPPGTTFDAVTQSYVADESHQADIGSATIKAFVHYPNFAMSAVKQFNEIETGDVILDVAPEAVIDGLDGLVFTVGGLEYVPKQVSEKLARAWDGIVQGAKLLRPVLLKRKT